MTPIEQNKVTYRLSQLAGRAYSYMPPGCDGVEYKAVKEASHTADDAHHEAAFALTTIRPTTMAGLLALLRHVDEFNAGAFFLEPDPRFPGMTARDWRSMPICWPSYFGEDDDENGDVDLFGFALLANVRRALEAMAVES